MKGDNEKTRDAMDYYRGGHTLWNMIPQYQLKEQNAFVMSTKLSMLYAERDAALEDRDRALSEKKAALDELGLAIRQRDMAFAERDNAIRERDNAIAALQFHESTMNSALHSMHGTKAITQRRSHHVDIVQSACDKRNEHITDAFPISAVPSEPAKARQVKTTKGSKVASRPSKSPRKAKKVGGDLNQRISSDGSKAEWDAQNLGSLNQINFDESTMAAPVCTCTGVPRQCYRWGNGGWQSSCCTTTLSVYPLPQMPNKKHSRLGGRKMSASVFSRLLTRLAAGGHDLSVPLDLKNYWLKHGTNRYITIK